MKASTHEYWARGMIGDSNYHKFEFKKAQL
jgi:hypothetical protein